MAKLGTSDNLELSAEVRGILHSIDGLIRTTASIQGRATFPPELKSYLMSSTHVAGALVTLAVSGVQCPLASPPANIQNGFDSAGNMRLECLHPMPNQHCWDLTGLRTTC